MSEALHPEPIFKIGDVVKCELYTFKIAGMYWSNSTEMWIYHDGNDSGWRGYEVWGEEDELELVEGLRDC